MSEFKVTVLLDGPLKVEGGALLQDHEDCEIPTREGKAIFLCRCGHSENKPFCDGTHKKVGFLGHGDVAE